MSTSAVTTDVKVLDVAPDIKFETFEGFLKEVGSPAVPAARAVYDYCVARRVSPAFIVAMFEHESQCGKAGTATQTHSWGNTRQAMSGETPMYFGVEPILVPTKWKDGSTILMPKLIAGRSGFFAAFAGWAQGGISTVARLMDYKPYFPSGRATVDTIIPVWAPSDDLNNPAGYGSKVKARMANLKAREQPVLPPKPTPPPGGTVQQPSWQKVYTSKYGYAQKFDPKFIVSHITAAKGQGDTEPTNCQSQGWLSGDDNGRNSPSCHFLVCRDGTIKNIVPLDQAPWTNGVDFDVYPRGINPATKQPIYDTTNPHIAHAMHNQISPNVFSLTIEHEGKSGSSMNSAQWDATARLQAWLCWRFNIVPKVGLTLVRHGQIDKINRSYCPGWTAAQWTSLEIRIKEILGSAPAPTPKNLAFTDAWQQAHGLGSFTAAWSQIAR